MIKMLEANSQKQKERKQELKTWIAGLEARKKMLKERIRELETKTTEIQAQKTPKEDGQTGAEKRKRQEQSTAKEQVRKVHKTS